MVLSTVLGKMRWKRQKSDQEFPGKWNVSRRMALSLILYFRLLVGMIRDLKMWCKVESPCYQGSGSCAPGIILVIFAGADEQ